MAKGGYARISSEKGSSEHPSDGGTLGSRMCPDCHMAHGGECTYMAEGGAVDEMAPLAEHGVHSSPDNEEQHPERGGSLPPLGQKETQEEDSAGEQDLPTLSEALDLHQEVMKDRKRRVHMANGGKVADYEGEDTESSQVGDDDASSSIDAPHMADLTNDSDELDAPLDDPRHERGLNLEPVHTMSDREHDTSDASLVNDILEDRRRKKRGM